MRRELGDERARYGRKSAREQLDDALAWPAEHPFVTGIILVVIAGALLLAAARGSAVELRDLAVGDCLYVRAGGAGLDARPIGDERAVIEALLAGGAEKASCAASHGHEVSAIVAPPLGTPGPPGQIQVLLDRAVMQAMTVPLCEAAFAGFVGRPLDGSRYTTFPVVPDAEGAPSWVSAGRRTVCLVARSDGQWMDHPARGSAE